MDVKINLHIPTTWTEWRKLIKKHWSRLVFHVIGFRCNGCGTRMFFRNPEYESTIHNRRFMCHTWPGDKIKSLCSTCLAKEMVSRDVFTDNEHKCDWCGTVGQTTSWFNDYKTKDQISMTFGSGWFNGHYICRDCLTQVLQSPVKERSSRMEWHKGDKRSYCVNEVGVMDRRKTRQ